MNIVKFAKNAWRLRRQLSTLTPSDYRSVCSLVKECANMQQEYFEDLEKRAGVDNSETGTSKAIKAFSECVNLIVKDEFLEKATRKVLASEKKTFDKKAFDKSKFNYIISMPEETQEKIFTMSASAQKYNLTVIHKILTDITDGLDTWYSL